MDNLGKAKELLEGALSELDRTTVLRSRVPTAALYLAAAGTLALVDMAVSLHCVADHLGYEEASDDTK